MASMGTLCSNRPAGLSLMIPAIPAPAAKSLEMFMQSILDATLKQAQDKGTRKLTPVHL